MQLEFGGQRFAVAAGELIIGSDPTAGLQVGGDGVAARHAVVRQGAQGRLVVEPGAPGVALRVNGSAVGADPTPLFHGDRLGIGTSEVVVIDPSRSGPTKIFAQARVGGGRLVCLNDGREYPIGVVPFVLGRDAMAQVVIASPDASRHHAEIVSRPDGDVLVDLSANGTYVGGARISGRHELKALDVIRIGAEEFRYYPARQLEPEPSGPAAGAEFRLSDTLIGVPKIRPTAESLAPAVQPVRPLATLLVKSGSLKGERVAVKTAVVNVGRAEYNDVRLPDPSVSSSHAKLQLREGVWTLADLGSTNGTTVDGERVDDEVPLSPGAMLKLGDVSLLFDPLDERTARNDRTAVLPKAVPVDPPAPARAAPAAQPAVPTGFNAEPVQARRSLWVGLGIVVLVGALVALVFLV